MKQIHLVILFISLFILSCTVEKKVVYRSIIEHQAGEGGNEIYDKVLVYKLSSRKDSLCYYKEDKFLGSTIIEVNK